MTVNKNNKNEESLSRWIVPRLYNKKATKHNGHLKKESGLLEGIILQAAGTVVSEPRRMRCYQPTEPASWAVTRRAVEQKHDGLTLSRRPDMAPADSASQPNTGGGGDDPNRRDREGVAGRRRPGSGWWREA